MSKTITKKEVKQETTNLENKNLNLENATEKAIIIKNKMNAVSKELGQLPSKLNIIKNEDDLSLRKPVEIKHQYQSDDENLPGFESFFYEKGNENTPKFSEENINENIEIEDISNKDRKQNEDKEEDKDKNNKKIEETINKNKSMPLADNLFNLISKNILDQNKQPKINLSKDIITNVAKEEPYLNKIEINTIKTITEQDNNSINQNSRQIRSSGGPSGNQPGFPGGNGDGNDGNDDDQDDQENDPFIELSKYIVDMKPKDIKVALNTLIKFGSKQSIVLTNELTINFYKQLEPDFIGESKIFDNLTDLLRHRNPLMDSIIYLNNNNKDIIKVEIKDLSVNAPEIRMNDYIRSAFLYYFWVMIQGFPPKIDAWQPKIIRDTFGINQQEFNRLMTVLSSFSLNALDNSWVFLVEVNKLSPEIRNRLELGIAGYRYIKCIGLNLPTKPLSKKQSILYNLIYSLHINSLRLGIHPLYKSGTQNSSVSFNKNLTNFILDIYTADEITLFKQAKLLPNVPFSRDLQNTSYKTWTKDSFLQLQIFALSPSISSPIQFKSAILLEDEFIRRENQSWYPINANILMGHDILNRNIA